MLEKSFVAYLEIRADRIDLHKIRDSVALIGSQKVSIIHDAYRIVGFK